MCDEGEVHKVQEDIQGERALKLTFSFFTVLLQAGPARLIWTGTFILFLNVRKRFLFLFCFVSYTKCS